MYNFVLVETGSVGIAGWLVDVGPSMHNILPEVEKLLSMLVQKKLLYGKNDEVGVVLFGTEVNFIWQMCLKVNSNFLSEPKQFNDFLGHLCKFCQERNLSSFCDFLASKDITLISKSEAIDRFNVYTFSIYSIHCI
ncbi:Ku_N domain-containing protein/Ku_PK_bind domain-containing protein [Cephalotus follicularis]|uniref:Ku_N domain-containing protein/Ku_PK_bind domain-containing protein n=1 Tax=Cephalotus follicularis TaxID=3775 RepID=A0A1Q3D1L6_CEPFO|nr:Ku_N domain-containing protein/Ku_PK_bind domain-containing protein [Cephalotus follicularis]